MTKYYYCNTFLLASELWECYYRGMQRDLSKTFFEDRNQTVAKWRELGLICLQVAEGDF